MQGVYYVYLGPINRPLILQTREREDCEGDPDRGARGPPRRQELSLVVFRGGYIRRSHCFARENLCQSLALLPWLVRNLLLSNL